MMQKYLQAQDGLLSDGIISELEDGKRVRILVPLYYMKSCLSCHGEPKGERDTSGYPKEGEKEGQLGGAISVIVDMR